MYIPNGSGTFNTVTISSDLTQSSFTTGVNTEHNLFYYNGYLRYFNKTQISSGSTAPTGPDYLLWYDTTNNLVKTSSDGGSTWSSGVSLPLCKFTATNNTITSIDQVFNGFGYIGSTVFVLPGVKGLIPNGRNENGTLKNIEFTNNSVKISNVADGVRTLVVTPSIVAGYIDTIYHSETNTNTNAAGAFQDCCHSGYVTVSSGVITLFRPKTTFNASDTSSVIIRDWSL